MWKVLFVKKNLANDITYWLTVNTKLVMTDSQRGLMAFGYVDITFRCFWYFWLRFYTTGAMGRGPKSPAKVTRKMYFPVRSVR